MTTIYQVYLIRQNSSNVDYWHIGTYSQIKNILNSLNDLKNLLEQEEADEKGQFSYLAKPEHEFIVYKEIMDSSNIFLEVDIKADYDIGFYKFDKDKEIIKKTTLEDFKNAIENFIEK